MDYQDEREQDHQIIWRDVLLLIAFTFMALMVMLATLVNDPGKEDDGNVKFKGSVIVEMHWNDTYASDVDLWVKSPGDPVPVGFSNKGSIYFNLLRDDLGDFDDTTGENFEMAITKGLIDGEYIVNVHLYAFKTGVSPDILPMEVVLRAYMLNNQFKKTELVSTKVLLRKPREQITAFRFSITGSDSVPILKPGSVNAIPHQLFFPAETQEDGR